MPFAPPGLPFGTATALGPTAASAYAVTDAVHGTTYYFGTNPFTDTTVGGVLSVSNYGAYTISVAINNGGADVYPVGAVSGSTISFVIPVGYSLGQTKFFNGTAGSVSATFTAAFSTVVPKFWTDFEGPIIEE